MPGKFDRDYSIWFDIGDLVYVYRVYSGRRDIGTILSEEITDGDRREYEVSIEGHLETIEIGLLKHVIFKDRRKEIEGD